MLWTYRDPSYKCDPSRCIFLYAVCLPLYQQLFELKVRTFVPVTRSSYTHTQILHFCASCRTAYGEQTRSKASACSALRKLPTPTKTAHVKCGRERCIFFSCVHLYTHRCKPLPHYCVEAPTNKEAQEQLTSADQYIFCNWSDLLCVHRMEIFILYLYWSSTAIPAITRCKVYRFLQLKIKAKLIKLL